MKKSITIAVLLLAAVAAAFAQGYSNHKIKLGQKAPDLAYPDPAGKTLRLSEVNKGRLVLLDFWASWCGPCRISNRGLAPMYNQFKDRRFKNAPNGFTVVSVSLDENPGLWRIAIAADSLKWPYHMADLAHRGGGPSAKYGIEYIPQAFLIGPDGKILGKYMMAEEARADIEKQLASD